MTRSGVPRVKTSTCSLALFVALATIGCKGTEPAPQAPAPAATPAPPPPAPAPPAPPAPAVGRSEDGKVSVELPVGGARITSTFQVKGTALVWGNRVHVKLEGAGGSVLGEVFADAKAADIGQSGPFEASLTLAPVAQEQDVTLVVQGYSAKDGTPESVVKLPLKLGP